MTDRRAIATRIWLAISRELRQHGFAITLTSKATLDAVIAAAENELPGAGAEPEATSNKSPNAAAEQLATGTDQIKAATDQLCELTKRWTTYEDVPRSQQSECREIGQRLYTLGGEAAMRDAYYEATGRNRAATVIAAYFDGIGDWRW